MAKVKNRYFIKRSRGEKIFNVFNVILMLMLVMFFLFPLFNVVSISLSNEHAVLRGDVTIFPVGFNGQAYKKIFTHASLWTAIKNSIIVAGVGCVLSILALSIAAYPLAFGNFYEKAV